MNSIAVLLITVVKLSENMLVRQEMLKKKTRLGTT